MINKIFFLLLATGVILTSNYYLNNYLKKQEKIFVVSVTKIVNIKLKQLELDIKSGKITNRKYVDAQLKLFKNSISDELTTMSNIIGKPIYFKKVIFYGKTKDVTKVLLKKLKTKNLI